MVKLFRLSWCKIHDLYMLTKDMCSICTLHKRDLQIGVLNSFLPVGYQIRRSQKQDWCDKLLSELAKLDLKVVLIRNLILVVKSEGPLSWTKTLLSLSDYDTEQLVQYCTAIWQIHTCTMYMDSSYYFCPTLTPT